MFERFLSRSRNGSDARARTGTMPTPAIRALESRFVFDGAAAPAAAQASSDAAAQSHGGQTDHAADTSHAEPADAHPAAMPGAAPTGTETASANGRHEIVVIDRGVADLQTLLAGVPASAEVILIDTGRDGFDQLADALEGRSDIDAIHILSHGTAGDLRLGTGELTAATIQGRYAADLAIIGRALTATGDLLIYGCDFAAGETGARAAALLAEATGADVAASNDATGDSALGGDWDLEIHDGAIETGVVLNDAAQRGWHHLLASATISVSGDPVVKNGAGTTISTPRSSNGVSYLDVNSNVVGSTAFWASAGTVGGVNVSLRATVIAVGESDDAVSFATSATGNDATILVRAQQTATPSANQAGSVTIRWDLVRADDPSVAVMADIDFQIGDIDGVGGQPNTRESVTPSQVGLTSYTLANPTDLVVDTSNNQVRISGTQNETASPPDSVSIVRFDWTNVSSWQVKYDLAANGTTGSAAFQHDGNRGLTFTAGAVKTVPKVDLDGNDSSGATGNNYNTSYTEKGSAVAITDTDPLVTNTAATVSSATVVLTNAQAGDRLNVGSLPGGITANTSTGSGTITVTLSGDASAATYQAALQAITFDSTSSDPSTTDRIIKTHATSDGVQGTDATTTVSVVAVDDAPVNSVPSAQSLNEDGSLIFSSGNNTAITVGDVDVQSGNLTTTLSVLHGALTLGSTAGVTVSGNGTGTVMLTGTVAAINTALNGTAYAPAADYNGADTLTVTTNDNGNTGTGGPQSDTDTVGITVNPVNDAPVLDLDASAAGTGYAASYTEGGAGVAIVDTDVSVTDVDNANIASAKAVITNGSAGDVLSIAGALPGGITASYDLATYTLTLTGSATKANYEAALQQIRYTTTNDDPSTATRTIAVSVNDGSLDSNAATASIAVTAANDPPINAVPSSQSVAEDTALVFSSGNGNAITVSDADIESGTLTTTLSVLHGALTLGSTSGVTVSGNGTGTVMLTGTVSAINTALNGTAYAPAADYNGADTLTVTTNDNGNTGTGGPQSDTDTVGITVSPVNDAPVLDLDASAAGTGYAASYTEGGAGVAIVDTDVSVTDVDNANIASAKAVIINGSTGDDLSIAGTLPGGITASYDLATYTLTLTGSATKADYQTALQQIRYSSTNSDPSTTTRSIAVTVDDGALDSNTAVTSVAFTAVNDAPMNTVPAAQTVNEDSSLVFSTGNGNSLTVSDADAGTGTLTTTLSVLHGTLTLGSTGGVTVSGNNTDTVSLTGTVSAINAALNGTSYAPTADYNGSETLTVVTNDNGNTGSGGAKSDTDVLSITVTPVNDAPVNGLPAAQTVDEDTNLVFSTVNGNALTVSDVDAGGGSLTTTLSVLHGTLTLGSTANVAVSGSGTASVTLSGTVTDINAALNGTTYRGDPNYNGADTLTLTSDDGGNTGAGGAKSDSDMLGITVRSVEDPPTNSIPAGTQAAAEDTTLVFSAATGNAIQVADPDGGSLIVTLSTNQGLLSLSRLDGLTFLAGDGAGDATVTFSGTIADINAALDGLQFAPNADYNGTAQISLLTQDPARAADNFTNGGFEAPGYGAGSFNIVDQSAVPGWSTTASDHQIEIWNSGHNGVTAYEGNQFAEINATEVAALYQDFTAAAGSTVSLDFAHLGRLGTDTMGVKVTDLGADGAYGTGDDVVLFDKTYSDGNTAWGAYHETLAQTANGNTLRFEFRSVSAAGGSQSVGNFVDGIQIQQAFRAASTINLAIAPVADIVPDSVQTNEDTPITFNAITGTNGASADTFESLAASVTSVTQGSHGSVSFLPDGTMTYTPAADFNGSDSFTYTVTSGGTTETATVSVTVLPVNDAPVLDLDASGAGTGYATSYTERGPGVPIVDVDVSVVDVDNPAMASGRVVITNGSAGDTLAIQGTLPSGITAVFDPATFTLTLTGAATKADYQTALQQIRFSSDNHDPSIVTRNIAVSVNDGTLDSAVATTAVAFTAVNDAPVNGMPADQNLAEDGSLIFSTGAGNGISIADADAQGGALTTTLSVLHGTLTLGATTGVTVTGDRTGSVTLSGTVAAINAALDGTTYRPDADYNGADTLTVLTNDNGNTGSGGAQSDTDTRALAISAVNDAPRAGILPAIGSLDGDTVPGTDLGRFFSDVEGDVLSFSAGGLPAGLAIDPATGVVSGKIDRSASLGRVNGDYAVTITADDGHGGLTNRSFTWRVVDPAPIARDDGAIVDAATPLTGSVLADNGNGADSDPDGDPLSVSAVNGSAAQLGQPVTGSDGGRFTVRADGSYGFDPGGDFADLAAGQTRTTRITYTVSDGEGGVAQATLAVTVTGLNAAPAALAPGDRAAGDDDAVALPLGSLFPNPDGSALRYSAAGLPPGLAIDPATGVVSGTIDHAASGSTGLADYRITITATDPQGSESTRSFTFRVTNPAPHAADDSTVTVEDTPVAIDVLANDVDPDGDGLVIVATGAAAPRAGHGQVSVLNGQLVYTPDANFNGTDTITYAIIDENGGVSTASVTVTVTPANDAPDAGTLPDQYGRDGAPVSYDISSRFRDPDADPSVAQAPSGDSLSFAATGLPPGLSIDPGTGLITGTLPNDASAVSSYAVTVTATDAAGASVARSFTWTVSNDAPIAVADSATTRAGAPVLVTVTTNDADPDGDAIQLVDASAAHGSVSVDPSTGLLSYTPEPGFSGRDTIVYTIEDAQGGRATGILTVTVTPVNERPIAPETLPGRNAADGESVRVPLGDLIVDPEGATLVYSVTGLPPGLAIDPATGEITGTIDRAASGPSGRTTYVVTLTATDPGGLSVSRSLAWTVSNPAPSAGDDAMITPEDTPVDIDVTTNDTDPDGDPLSVVPGSAVAGHGTVTLNPDGSLHYLPDHDFNGTDHIVYTITDGNGGFATASVAVTVTPVNDGPTFDPASPALADSQANDAQAVSIPAGSAFHDVDVGDRLTFTATGLPPGLSVDPATGLISGSIASDASTRAPAGVYTITLTGTDLAGASATTRLTITVANPAPIAVDDAATLLEDAVLIGNVLGNDRDPDGDAIHVDPVPVAGPAHGRLDLHPDGSFSYTPDADFHGDDSFTYALVDSDGGRSTATVQLTVASVNDVPVANADSLTLPANTVGTGYVVATDRDGDRLSFRLVGMPANGSVTLAANGSYSYKPYAAFSGADRFTVEVSDGNGGSTIVAVEITVTPNPVQVPPSALVPVLAPQQPFVARAATAPVLPPGSAIAANGFILPAVAEIDALGSIGDVVLADGAVVAAVNGVASLHGTTIITDHPVMLAESDRIARLAWERFERVPSGETAWFSPRPYLGRSLGVSFAIEGTGWGTSDLMVEAIRRPDTLSINLRGYASELTSIAAVRIIGIDGAPRPDWLESDGKGGFWGRPPAGTGLVKIELEIELENGRVVRRPLSVDAETGEIRALPAGRPVADPEPLGTREPDSAPRAVVPLFTAQLASLEARGARDLALVERALTRGE